MVEPKVLVILIGVILVAGFTSAIEFDVEVDAEANASVQDVKYDKFTDSYHNFNATLENIASVGCTYYLRGTYKHENNESEIRYSNGYAAWPGSTEFVELKYLPENYTGSVETQVDLIYCGHEEELASFEFDSTANNTGRGEVESSTVEVNSSQSKIDLSVNNGTLIPKEVPPYWKVGYADITNSSATVSYDAPITHEGKDLIYAVVDPDGNLVGETEVELVEPEPTLKEKLRSNVWAIFAGLFGLSGLLNLYLARRIIVPEWVREYLSSMEFGDRDIRS